MTAQQIAKAVITKRWYSDSDTLATDIDYIAKQLNDDRIDVVTAHYLVDDIIKCIDFGYIDDLDDVTMVISIVIDTLYFTMTGITVSGN